MPSARCARRSISCATTRAQCESLSNDTHRPLGLVACISPWNFPLSIFTGQIAGALAAGNAVIAKPAEETPLIAAQAVRAPARGRRAARACCSSCPATARSARGWSAIQRSRAWSSPARPRWRARSTGSSPGALGADGKPPPLIAETGGQNALIANSSALPEQLVLDALTSAFDSAGQRCSALRVLCLQDDIADRVLPMLKGAMAELRHRQSGSPVDRCRPGDLAEAQQRLLDHIERMRAAATAVHPGALPDETRQGIFVPPTIIEIESDRRPAGRGVRPGPARAALSARGHGGGGAVGQRYRLRPHLRRAQPHRRDDRPGDGERAPPATSTSTAT